ncbi:hypothetical protein [Streptomyces sp. WAC01526]|uniref:hypothetical protein n=1 Tax=Streptomyces sp. WAC01526 TaxID=2588709 RepID=UPI0011E068CA|nr:hypothetical protein [Streptomyces sp. WAC01526]
MTKREKASERPFGEAPSRHKGTHQHGWSPDVDETRQEDNPSAHRSFHPGKYAPKSGPNSATSKEETGEVEVEGNTVKSTSRRGEQQTSKEGEKGMHDTGPRGRTQRPSGSKDASAYTGVDPQEPSSD